MKRDAVTIMLNGKFIGVGHRDVKETLNTYSHLFPNAQKKILESIDEGAEM